MAYGESNDSGRSKVAGRTKAWSCNAWLVLVIGLLGCSGGSQQGVFTGDDTSLAGALEQLPVSTGATEVIYVDYRKASELLSVTPASGEHIGLMGATSTAEGGLGVRVPVPSLLRDQMGVDLEFGFSLDDVSAVAVAHYGSANDFIALVGPDDWAGSVAPLGGMEVATYGTGSDGQMNLAEATDARQLGRPLRVARRGQVLGSSISTDLIVAWMEGEGDVLADSSTYQELVDEMESAFVVRVLQNDFDGAADAVITEAFDRVAVGSSMVEGRARETVVYWFGSSDAAKRAEPSVRDAWTNSTRSSGEPISDFLNVLETRQRGELVVVEFEVALDRIGIGAEVFFAGEATGVHR